MDTYSFTCITPEVKRLTTFQRRPLPNQRKLSISNSPAKLASAGFSRSEHATNDEVTCEYCGIVYDEWSGESPYAVHRVLREDCPFLSTPSPVNSVQNHPRVLEARRRLFPVEDASGDESGSATDEAGAVVDDDARGDENSEASDAETESDTTESGSDTDSIVEGSSHSQEAQSTFVSVLNPQTHFTFPFQPRVGYSSMLFASRRLKTFTDPGCPECIDWAEEGFVYRTETRDVQCVFCAAILPFHTCEPKLLHAEQSIFCPLVLLKDVGNISTAEEERIRLKNLQRQLKNKSLQQSYAICHPQYEDESCRAGTFENWPYSSWDETVQKSVWSEAGFYYTGCADKVKCYSCGVGLYKWRQGSDPWIQHALHMPTCPHLQVKGQHFIQQAVLAEVLTEADKPSMATSSPPDSAISGGQLVTSPPGALTMDMDAVTAAVSTSHFPTKDILLGTLRAADENFTTVCQQRETIYQKDTVIQQKDTALQQKDTVIEQKDTVIEQKDTVIEQKDTVIEQKDTALQQTYTQLQQQSTELQQHVGMVEQQNQELQQHRQELQHRDAELQHQREELQRKEEELQRQEEKLERKNRQMRYQEQQIESLRIQMQALLADRRRAGQQAAPLQPAVVPVAQNRAEDSPVTCDIRCKVCLSAESNTIFQPCLHITCCNRCADQLVNACCPVCRAPIRNVLPAYIS